MELQLTGDEKINKELRAIVEDERKKGEVLIRMNLSCGLSRPSITANNFEFASNTSVIIDCYQLIKSSQ